MLRYLAIALWTLCSLALPARAGEAPLRLAIFQADVTPPLGTPLCDALVQPAREIVDPLSARGIVLLSGEKPIVLCAVDWVGIGNSGYDAFRDALARAAGTTRERVAVHCLHQHDAPGCDFLADEVLKPHGLGGKLFDPVFARKAIERVADAVSAAVKKPVTVTHVGVGKAKVEQVASNRRVPGPDGKVKYVRYSATRDPKIRAEPEGLIDPYVHLLSFWDGERPLVSITYYATHPQSYYGKGGVSCDFPGLARGLREKAMPGTFHVHFNGAGGNVTAGKYNDGSPENRPVLAGRLAKGMQEAFAAVKKTPIKASDVAWRVTGAALPLSKLYQVKELEARVADEKLKDPDRLRAARNLVWARRCVAGEKIDISCLRVGPAYVLHLPGELFIEYQLAAQKMRPQSPVLMAAYGDYGPGYIGTAIAYTQGGYETGPVSRVGPGVEEALMRALRELLK
ncbi:MAG TPA: hypothetical protein VEL76_19450 [Gemmataceae bacterium]|nr:hypothetical protein [Gemmataceae bacterium]